MNFASPDAQALETAAAATTATTQTRREDPQQQRVHYTNEVSYMYPSTSKLPPLLDSNHNEAILPTTCSPLPSIKQALTQRASMHTSSGPSPPSVLLASTLSPQHTNSLPVSACVPRNALAPLPSRSTISNHINPIPPVSISLPASISSPPLITSPTTTNHHQHNHSDTNIVRSLREGTTQRTGDNQESTVQALSPRLGVSCCLPHQNPPCNSTSQKTIVNDKLISKSNKRRSVDKQDNSKKSSIHSTPYLTALLQARALHDRRFNETRLKHHITDPIRGCRSISNEARERVRVADAASNQPGASTGTLAAATTASNRSTADHPSLPPPKRKRSSISMAAAPGINSQQNVVATQSIVPSQAVVPPNALVSVTTPDLTVGLASRHATQPTQLKIAVEFSMTSGSHLRAAWIATELINEFHSSITEVGLVPRNTAHIFNIWIGGKMAWSRGEGQPLPDYAHLQPIVRAQCRQAGM